MRRCQQCHRTLPFVYGRGRPRKWCSDACRQKAWRQRQAGGDWMAPFERLTLFVMAAGAGGGSTPAAEALELEERS